MHREKPVLRYTEQSLSQLVNRCKGDIVRIKWQDPTTSAGWFDSDKCEELDVVETIGVFIKENEKTIWFASTYHKGTEEFADQLIFPKGCILHIEVLGEVTS